ncbi:MAG: hypothetical protein RI925_1869 [Pseudomonadota bacterium]
MGGIVADCLAGVKLQGMGMTQQAVLIDCAAQRQPMPHLLTSGSIPPNSNVMMHAQNSVPRLAWAAAKADSHGLFTDFYEYARRGSAGGGRG